MSIKRISKRIALIQVLFYALTILSPFANMLPKVYADGPVPGLDCGNYWGSAYAGLECYIRGILRPVSVGAEYSASCESISGGWITHSIQYSSGARFRFCFGSGHSHPLTNQEAIQKVRYTSNVNFVVIESLQSYGNYNQTPLQPGVSRPQNGWELGPRTNGTYSSVSCSTTFTGAGCSVEIAYTINDPDYANYISSDFQLENQTNGSNQNWNDNRNGSFTRNLNLTDGNWRLRGITSDTWVNSGWTGYRTFIVDTTAPAIPVINAEPEYSATTQNQISVTTVTDNVIGGVQYEFEMSDQADFSTTINSSGWINSTNYTFASLTDETTYYYRTRSRDSLHNVSAWSAVISSTQDATLPILEDVLVSNERISPQNLDGTLDTTSISFKVTEKYPNQAKLKITNAVNATVRELVQDITAGGLTQNINFIWDGKDNATNLVAGGAYTLVLEITDLAGNLVTADSLIVIVDNTPASFQFSNLTNGGWLNQLSYNAAGQTESDAVASLNVDPTNELHNLVIDGSGLFTQIVNLALGENTLSANVEDSIGNAANYQTSVYVEQAVPDVVISTPTGNTNNRRPVVNLNLTDNGSESNAIEYISGINPNSIYLGLTHATQGELALVNEGNNIQPALGSISHDCDPVNTIGNNYVASCNYTYTFNADLTPDGEYTITARTRDIAGNQSNNTTSGFALDSNTSLSISTPTNGQAFNYSNIEITGSAEAGATIKVFVDDLNADGGFEAFEFVISDNSNADYTVDNCRDSANPNTDGIRRICDFKINNFQLERQLIAGAVNNIIHTQITDTFGNTQTINTPVSVDLFAVNLSIGISNEYFSPNGDGRQDGLEFRNISTDAQLQSYAIEILHGGNVVRSFTGNASLPTNLPWDGRDSNGNFLTSGVYQYRLKIVSTDGVEFTTTPQDIEAVTELTDRVVITNPDTNSFSSRGVINVQGQAPIGSTVKLCDDLIGLADSCDFEFSAQVNFQGSFSLIMPLYRLDGSTNTEHLIKAWAVDKYGNHTDYSNTVKVTVTTLSPFDSIEILPVFTGVNNEVDYQLILSKLDNNLPITQSDIQALRSVVLRSKVNSGTERVKLSFSSLTNLSELPVSLQQSYLGYIDGEGETRLYQSYTDGVNALQRCLGTNCTWDFYYPVPPQLGGLYEVWFEGKLDAEIQTLSAAFTVDGRIPTAPMILDINKQVGSQLIDTNTFEGKYYSNSVTIQIRGVADPAAVVTVGSDHGQICQATASSAGIWQCVVDISAVVGSSQQLELELNLSATVGANTVVAPQNDYLIYDVQAPIFNVSNSPTAWRQSGDLVELAIAANEKLAYVKHVDTDPNTVGSECINATHLIPILNIQVQLGAVNDFVLTTNRQGANGSFTISGFATEGRYCNFVESADLAGNKATQNQEWYIDNTEPVTPTIETAAWGLYNGLNTQPGYIAQGRLVPGYVHEEPNMFLGIWVEQALNTQLYVDTQVNQTQTAPNNITGTCRVRENPIGIPYTDIVVDGVLVQSATECLAIFNYTFAAGEKGYLFQGKVTDNAGNTSLISPQQLVYYDKTAPRTPETLEAKKSNSISINDWQIARDQNNTAVRMGTGNFGSLPITNDPNLSLTDYGEARSDMQYWAYAPNAFNFDYKVETKDDSGRNTNNYQLAYGDGVYSFGSRSTDAAGNTSVEHYMQIELDTVTPNNPAVGLGLNGGDRPTGIQMTVMGEPGTRPSIATSAKLSTSGRTSFQIKSLSIDNDSDWERTFTYCTALTDRAGNRSGSVCRSIQTPIRPIRAGECDLTPDRQAQIQQILNGNTVLPEGQGLASLLYSRSCLYYAPDVVNSGLESAQSDLKLQQESTQQCIKEKSEQGLSTQEIVDQCGISKVFGTATANNMLEGDTAQKCMNDALLASTSLDDAIKNCNVEKYYEGDALNALKEQGKEIENKIIERDHFESLNWAQQLGYRFVKGAYDLANGVVNLVVNTGKALVSLGTQAVILAASTIESVQTGKDLGQTYNENKQDVKNGAPGWPLNELGEDLAQVGQALVAGVVVGLAAVALPLVAGAIATSALGGVVTAGLTTMLGASTAFAVSGIVLTGVTLVATNAVAMGIGAVVQTTFYGGDLGQNLRNSFCGNYQEEFLYSEDYIPSFGECLAYTAGGNALTALPISKLLGSADDAAKNVSKVTSVIDDGIRVVNNIDTVLDDLANTTKNFDNAKIVDDIKPKPADVCTGQACGAFDDLGNPLCFVAGTKVSTISGYKNIEDIKVGELVLARNEFTGEVTYQDVLFTPVTNTKDVIDVVTQNETISSTPNHRFWVEGKAWVDAKNLAVGDLLMTSTGLKVAVTAVNLRQDPQTVYNLTVDEFHTYFVGEESVWVHNQYNSSVSSRIWSATRSKTSIENALGHWNDHKSDFPFLNNAKEYVELTHELVKNPPVTTLSRFRTNGEKVSFDPATQYFWVAKSDGTPKTLFIPDPKIHGEITNLDYYLNSY